MCERVRERQSVIKRASPPVVGLEVSFLCYGLPHIKTFSAFAPHTALPPSAVRSLLAPTIILASARLACFRWKEGGGILRAARGEIDGVRRGQIC